MRKRLVQIVTALWIASVMLQPLQVHASILRDNLIRIHASLLPKTVFMDYRFKQRLDNGSIKIHVLCKKSDIYYAKDFVRYVRKLYPDGINGLKVTTRIQSYANYMEDPCSSATIFYLLPADKQTMKQAIKEIKSALIFSYSPASLQYGSHISLKIKYRVRPILNLEALKESGISLRPAILRISDIYIQALEE